MGIDIPTIPESCSRCPHLDQFHNACSHPFRQSIVREAADADPICPVYIDVRANAMRDLEERLK